MSIKIALAGNPNCGKTTLFNALTGSRQYVGNWPGVTVEKKEGNYIKDKNIVILDLPGIYSLSPYTKEEVVTRKYLVEQKPDVILNIVDATNIERNLYLTLQLKEVGIPVVIALNMMDIVRKNKDKIDTKLLSKELSCPIIEISASKGENINETINACIKVQNKNDKIINNEIFTGNTLKILTEIEDIIKNKVDDKQKRWFAVKIFEKDISAYCSLKLDDSIKSKINKMIKQCEKENEDTSDAIIIDQRYKYITNELRKYIVKNIEKESVSSKIDKILTHRIFALPIFIFIMFIIYSVSMGNVGGFVTNWISDGLFGESFEIFGKTLPGIPNIIKNILINLEVVDWIQSLILDGIVAGVSTVISFVPQITILFIFLTILEDCGYMSRIAFIFDRIFRKFGLSGKSFIPLLVGTGCSVPAIMSARTIEEEKDRKMTIMLSSFMPCSAKMEMILFLTNIFFPGNAIIATSMYFVGIMIIILAGISLKKLKCFSGDKSSFVMELPNYHIPSIKNVFMHVWERVKGYMVKAGTVIFLACMILWFLMNFDFRFQMVDVSESILKSFGDAISFIFLPLGFGHWQGVVSSLSAEFAKEQATATLSMIAISNIGKIDLTQNIRLIFNNNKLAGLSFMIFNIFNAPCIVAIITTFKEMENRKTGIITVIFQILVGYILALIVFQIGSLITNASFDKYSINCVPIAIMLILFIMIMVFRPNPYNKK